MKQIVLSIDTSRYDFLKIGLTIGTNSKVFQENFDYRKSQNLLPFIHKIMLNENITFSDLTGVEVVVGPGSFTGLRVGVSVANSLGRVLNIPINNLPVGVLVEPVYA